MEPEQFEVVLALAESNVSPRSAKSQTTAQYACSSAEHLCPLPSSLLEPSEIDWPHSVELPGCHYPAAGLVQQHANVEVLQTVVSCLSDLVTWNVSP